MSKDLINTGVAGDSTTGDSLFVGGGKINSMFQEVYDAFAPKNANPQIIQATGYYQTPARTAFTFPVPTGSQQNIDTRNGSIVVKLPNGKVGDMVRVRDVYGSWEHSPCTVRADGLEKIDGEFTDVVFSQAFTDLTFVCIDDTPGSVNWTYSAQLLSSRNLPLIDKTFVFTPTTPVTYVLGSVSSFTAATLMISGLMQLGGLGVTSSETHIAHDGTNLVYSESAVLSTGTSRVFDIDFSIQSGNVVMSLTTTIGQVKVQVKSTNTTRILI
ncbi:baseplate wedge tail fiber connector [Pseudomonas phage Astolliot]|nr:baseplate wedge tail fiber connector [Pseudomonas phage Astolliot]